MEFYLEHFVLFLSWLSYYTLHSILADKEIKYKIEKRAGAAFRYYRFLFNIQSLVLFGFLIYWQFSITSELLISKSSIVQIVGAGVLVFGTVVLTHAFFTVDLREFLGLEQYEQRKNYEAQGQSTLIRSGWYAYVRHPFYFGTVLMLIGAWLIIPSLAMLTLVAATIVYLPFGIYLEERKLIQEFGDAYRRYRKEVKAVIPFVL